MEADQSDFEIAGVAAFLPALASLPLLSKPIKQ